MKNEKLFDAIGNIEDDIIEEADMVVPIPIMKNHAKRNGIKYVSIAALLCLAIGISFFTMVQDKIEDKGIAVVEDAVKGSASIKYGKSDKLSKISFALNSEGGGGGDIGHFVIKDLAEIVSDNPTRNNDEAMQSMTELPVFKNEPNLWSEYYNQKNASMTALWSERYESFTEVNELLYFDMPAYEDTNEYNFEGIDYETWYVCYKHDSTKGIMDQLLDYSFYRMEYSIANKEAQEDTNEGMTEDTGWVRVMTPPSQPGILYPIITLEEAKEKLRNGDLLCYGGEDAVAKTAEIRSVEIVYLTDEFQTYLQPYYKFLITDKSWDLTSVMNDFSCKNPEDFYSISPVFVPAVRDEYLEVTEPELYFN